MHPETHPALSYKMNLNYKLLSLPWSTGPQEVPLPLDIGCYYPAKKYQNYYFFLCH